MYFYKMNFKKIPLEHSNFIVDKLTRFKPAKIRFKILFDSILSKYYLDKISSSLNELERADIAVEIINSSFKENEKDNDFKKMFLKIEDMAFLKDSLSKEYLNLKINWYSLIKSVSFKKDTPKNVAWLINIADCDLSNLDVLRTERNLLYPLKGVILCEGQTENTLLDTIFKLYKISLDKLGYIVIPAGGKNQVARKYYELVEYLNLPVDILLDKDAVTVKALIEKKLRKKDKLYLIKSGEFEDLIPKEILLNTINSIHNNDFNCNIADFEDSTPMSHNLEQIYKKYGYGEFKKAQFAKELNDYIKSNCLKDDFKTSETEEIVAFLFNK